jgi:hypothetical protein
VLLNALSVLGVACSPEQDGAVSGSVSGDLTAAETLDVCAIVSREEAAAVLGAPVVAGEPKMAN